MSVDKKEGHTIIDYRLILKQGKQEDNDEEEFNDNNHKELTSVKKFI